MAQNKETNARITQWFLELQHIRLKVEHRAGKLHGNADALSQRTECLCSIPSRGGQMLRGRVCGTPSLTWCPTEGAAISTKAQRWRRPLGQVVEGPYLPKETGGIQVRLMWLRGLTLCHGKPWPLSHPEY